MSAAVDYVAEHGLGDVSLRQLATALGTSHRMLIYHFGSKHGLLVEVIKTVEARQREIMAAMAAETEQAGESAGAGLRNAITASADEHSALFAWSDATPGFCAAVNPERPMDPRKQARRQFAAFLANLCAGETGTTMRDGGVVSLDPGTQVAFAGHETTFGALALSVDARLAELQNASLDGAGVRGEYGRIADAIGAFNEGNGFPVTCASGRGSSSMPPAPEARLMIASPNPSSGRTTVAYAVGAGESADIGVFERLIDTPDPDIEMSLFGGQSLGEADLDELIGRLRRFHGLEQAD